MHVRPPEHAGEHEGVTHAPPVHVWPVGHAAPVEPHTHAPPTQVSPPVHAGVQTTGARHTPAVHS